MAGNDNQAEIDAEFEKLVGNFDQTAANAPEPDTVGAAGWFVRDGDLFANQIPPNARQMLELLFLTRLELHVDGHSGWDPSELPDAVQAAAEARQQAQLDGMILLYSEAVAAVNADRLDTDGARVILNASRLVRRAVFGGLVEDFNIDPDELSARLAELIEHPNPALAGGAFGLICTGVVVSQLCAYDDLY